MSSNKRFLSWQALMLPVAAMSLGGCKTLLPYESTFACEKSTDYGACMDVQTAYDNALGEGGVQNEKKNKKEWRYRDSANPQATPQDLKRLPKAKTVTANAQGKNGQAMQVSMNSADLYRELEYRELASLIERPVTPLVRPPKVLRTLIVSYTAAESLYMPRYVFYFADNAQFVMGDYLNPADVRPVVYPNGNKTAAK